MRACRSPACQLGTWRNADTPNPDAPPLPPLDLTGAQAPTVAPGGRGGGGAHAGLCARSPRRRPRRPWPSRRAWTGRGLRADPACFNPELPARGARQGPLGKLLGTL